EVTLSVLETPEGTPWQPLDLKGGTPEETALIKEAWNQQQVVKAELKKRLGRVIKRPVQREMAEQIIDLVFNCEKEKNGWKELMEQVGCTEHFLNKTIRPYLHRLLAEIYPEEYASWHRPDADAP